MKVVSKIFIYVLICIVLLGIVIAFAFSTVYYNPIAEILSWAKGDTILDEENKDEMCIIKNIFKSLHIKNKKYEENLILSRLLSKEEYNKDAETIFLYEQFQVVVIYNSAIEKAIEYVKQFLENHPLHQGDIKIVKFNTFFCMIINFSDENLNQETLEEYLFQLKSYIDQESSIFSAIGISDVCHHVSRISYALDQATLAIKYGDSSNRWCIYKFSQDKDINYSLYFPLDFESMICECIYKGNKGHMMTIIEDIFEKNYGIPNFHMKNLVVEFINSYLKIGQKFNHKINIEEIDHAINREYRAEAIKKYLQKLYSSLVQEENLQPDTTTQVGTFVIQYIEENYADQGITIEEISDQLDLSTAYVSTLFKKHTGIAFSQYLLDYRLMKAKELLENTDYKVKDISDMSGFGTYNNFAKAFKKKIGSSPGSYRNACL